MAPMTEEQKQLIFDYCVGLTDPQQSTEAQALIDSNKQAYEVYSGLLSVLRLLESAEIDLCPDELVEKTISRVNEAAGFGQQKLEHLLAVEQAKSKPYKISLWRNMTETIVAAAAVVLFISILVPAFGYARQKYYQNQCQAQMSSIFTGLSKYIDDNDDRQPAVATKQGDPWCRIGYQGEENHSNTRHIFLLVKGNYVEMSQFVCCGSRKDKTDEVGNIQINDYKDFPNKSYITYSFQINCGGSGQGKLECRKVIMADMNPLFEAIKNSMKSISIRLDRKTLTINSRNHRRNGQNVLFGDGSIEFFTTRYISYTQDDIFTLQDTDIYRGNEKPSCETDSFLAP